MSDSGRLLAVDPGKVRIGLAVCDKDRRIASPLEVYTRRDRERDARYLKKVVEEEDIVQIVLGLPMHTTGREGPEAHKAREFGQWLTEKTGRPVVFWDERFTSQLAESALWNAGLTHNQRKARRDALAAQIMLQHYLEAGCPTDAKFGDLAQ